MCSVPLGYHQSLMIILCYVFGEGDPYLFFPGRRLLQSLPKKKSTLPEKRGRSPELHAKDWEENRRRRDDHRGSEGGTTEEKMKREGPDRIQERWNSSGPTRK